VFAIIAGAAVQTCICPAEQSRCLGCRARVLQAALTASGIRIKRWRNAIGGQRLRRIGHTAGPVVVQRQARPSCPRYIVDRRQLCANCPEELAAGKWALFFTPGENVTKLEGKDGRQLFARPVQAGDNLIPCGQLRIIPASQDSQSLLRCESIRRMTRRRGGGRLPFGWVRDSQGNVVASSTQQTLRSVILDLRAQGLAYRVIANVLNAAGQTTQDGQLWEAMTVQRVATRANTEFGFTITRPEEPILSVIQSALDEAIERGEIKATARATRRPPVTKVTRVAG